MKSCLRVISALLLLVPACSEPKVPRIEVVGPAAADFGPYPAEQKKAATYTIRNAGNDVLRLIRVRNACGCATTAVPTSELKPGEEGTIEVTILPHSIRGPYSKTTFVESNDPVSRFVRLEVSGNAIPLVEIKPGDYFYVGRIPTNQPLLRTFDLRATRSGVTLGEPVSEGSGPAETTLEAVGVGTSGLYRLEVRFPPIPEAGDFHGSITIPVLEPARHPPLKISISGKAGSELAAVPGVFDLPASDTPIQRTFRLRILGTSTVELRPESVHLPEQPGVTFSMQKPENKPELLATVSFSPDFLRDLSSEKEIRFSISFPGVSSATIICKAKNRGPR